MNSHARSLMFLFGMAPLGLGCNGSKADDEGRTDDTGETGSTGASGDGSTTDDGPMSDDDGSTTGSTGDLCEDYAAAYANCYQPYYTNYSLEWCQQAHFYYSVYSSPACFDAWEATIACRTTADCGYSYIQCEAEFQAQLQACQYTAYNGCDLIGEMVGGCISPKAGDDAALECDQTYVDLYAQHGGWCADAFLQMMVCISQLECQALSDKQYVYANCEAEILNKNQACQ